MFSGFGLCAAEPCDQLQLKGMQSVSTDLRNQRVAGL